MKQINNSTQTEAMTTQKTTIYFKMHAWATALKVGFACFIALCLIAKFNISNGYAMLLPMIVVPTAYHAAMERTFLERFLGAFLGSALSVLLLFFTENWMIYTAIITVILIFGFAYGVAKNIKYTMVWALITIGLMYSSAHSNIQEAETMIISWVRNLWIGSAIYLLVDYAILPKYPFTQLQKLLKKLLVECHAKNFLQETSNNIKPLPADDFSNNFKNYLKIRLSEAKILLKVSRYRVSSEKLLPLEIQIQNLSDLLLIPASEPIKINREIRLSDLSQSAKTCFTFLATLLISLYLGLPGGFQIVVVAAVASMQPNLGDLNKKIYDRLMGASIGSCTAMIFIFILGQISTLWCLMLLSVSWVTTTTYMGISRPRWFYVAVQACVIVLLILTMDTHQIVPTTDVMWQRIIAIFEGYFIATLILILLNFRSKQYLKSPVNSSPETPDQKTEHTHSNPKI
jgi:uncharacterized membrane protein YccC